MSTTARGLLSNCTTYIVSLDAHLSPIPSTMRSKNNNAQIDKGFACREAILPTTQMVLPAGVTQCFHENKLRYFYKVNSQTGRILSNSMWEQKGKPVQMCNGVFSILEYLIFQPY